MLTLHILALSTIFTTQLLAMRQERLYNIQEDGGVSFLGGSHQVVIDDKKFMQGAEAEPAETEEDGDDSSELLAADATELLGGLE